MSLYVITDPVYLLKSPEQESAVEKLVKTENRSNCIKTAEYLSSILNTRVYRVSATGYGNWLNFITTECKDVKVLKTSFCSDSGLMCLVEASAAIQKKINSDALGNYAVIKTDREITYVDVDTSNPEWYIMNVYSNDERIVRTDDYDIPF